ncbi:hypothetical protein G6F62_004702 [Rhizopus arrhizus]|nr:hypothetical protein G6F24_008741 [Rhizopus arrhizus]KAG1413999.1 hypothetical protein G6F58_007180 [Rhizopus delemar]KAG0798059.1 hypothetical protein G6F22_004573 [Rhizopus arrhizus]KAG0895285.1 hypothetical protein G6F34_008364 [Rhizopus arrhizus]KAG1236661.1 hypothetical protein G6F35_000753 [Rhizopus arrhizus]
MTSHEIRQKSNQQYDRWIALGLFVLAIPVRFKNISFPSQVVFDEVHFGKYAAYYIQQSFFFDVHPPLAKLLIAFVGWLSGFDGDFDFTSIGMEYPENVPYVQMRALGAFFGTLVVPIAYMTIRDCGHSNLAALIAALSLCFENGLIANNRLILSFSGGWWTWLLLTGIGIGCSFSSKWVGLFTMATIGLSTIKQLWQLLGNLHITKAQYASHFIYRFFGLFIVPIIVYMATFYIHFAILTKPGAGDTFMTIEMQNELKGLQPAEVPLPIVYGSLITLRHLDSVNGYLHSHKAFYPEGSQQQQITLYPFRDDNNWWRILKANETEQKLVEDLMANDNKTPLQYVRNGDLVRLEHVETAPRKLHSHDEPAPVTETTYHKEVSGYGFPDHEGDSNDFWKVEIEDDGQLLEARTSRFRLYHPNQLCRLYSNLERLPAWGFNQHEVSCMFEGKKQRTMWMIDEHANDLLPKNIPKISEHRPNFFEKFLYLQKKMWTVNQGLTERHPYESRPSAWPVLLSGISFWTGDKSQIFLLGHPLIYWASTVSVFNSVILMSFFALRDKRGFHDHFSGLRSFYERSAGFFAAAWALHYLPFYFMERQLFLHHYMPALYFSILTMSIGLDMITRRLIKAKPLVLTVLVVVIIYTYFVYAPLTYGGSWDIEKCEDARLLETWVWGCDKYSSLSPVYVDPTNEEEEGHWPEAAAELEEAEEEIDEDWPVIETSIEETEDEEEWSKPTPTEEEEEEEDFETATYEEEDVPTEAPDIPEPESDVVEGTELVAGADEDEDDEWPMTVFGMDPEAEDNDTPAEIKDIPITKHVEL